MCEGLIGNSRSSQLPCKVNYNVKEPIMLRNHNFRLNIGDIVSVIGKHIIVQIENLGSVTYLIGHIFPKLASSVLKTLWTGTRRNIITVLGI